MLQKNKHESYISPKISPNPTEHQTTANNQQSNLRNNTNQSDRQQFTPSIINLPKGGGAIQGIGEKFQANPVTGTGSLTVPIAISPGRGGFTPQLVLSYDSGAGNSPFGLGWNIGLPSISRKTSKGLPEYDGLPKYQDALESDVFILSGTEDLVPEINKNDKTRYTEVVGDFIVYRYRPRIEGLFARIEKWVNQTDQSSFWKSITKENITTIYGQSANTKVVDPKDAWKVFEWKIEKTYDDKGNVIVYEYKKEDGAGLTSKPIFEKNRNNTTTYNQIYLKRVSYGNLRPYTPRNPAFDESAWMVQNRWLFELIFDYGEHTVDSKNPPTYQEQKDWLIRSDISSSFRAGFDLRTYRLCRNILMYHHFEDELGIPNCLVKATHLEHEEGPTLTMVKSITHTGYVYDAKSGEYISKSFPPVSFKYTDQKIDTKIYEINSAEFANAPQGIDGQQYQFNDLYGEGLNGILSQKEGAWYYKRNEGNGQFGAQQMVAEIPSMAVNANVQIADFGGNGLTDVVIQSATVNGFYELNEENKWSHFKPFAHPVNFRLDDPKLRMLDLDGNGVPDILITETDCFVWYPADAANGYKTARRVAKALDEEQGPRIVFNEQFQTIFLADMTGDGLTDIVRLRNGELCYWANKGYGHFSHQITMANAPHFDFPDYFDPSRIRLTDIDGSGTTDVLYIGRDEIQYWLNQSGNSWSEAKVIRHFPKTSSLHTVSVFDLLGNGTACIVWSSPLPAEANTPMKYIQLMGNTQLEGNKPYLVKEVNNNMGAITRLKYEASTTFYLEDRRQGKPWITRLPFPVQVLTRQEVYDEIAGNHFVSRYAYHHGYFDRVEREFRGFGMVEQWDTEDYESLQANSLFEHSGSNWSEEFDQPPVYTKSWFHNGFYKEGEKISRHFAGEYNQEDPDAWLLPDTELPAGLDADEQREAARALKGQPLRVEVYGMEAAKDSDGNTVWKPQLFTATESKYHIKTIQSKGNNRHACFYACPCESLTYHYEKNPSDPRIAHQQTLEVDDFGNVLKAAAIVYPRRIVSDHPEQSQIYLTYTEADFINEDTRSDFYRIGIPAAQRTFEITGLGLPKPFEKEALKDAITAATEIDFSTSPGSGTEKRLLQAQRMTYYSEDLQSELPLQQVASHGLPYKTVELVFTKDLLDKTLAEKAGTDYSFLETEAGYIREGDHWWRPTGRMIFDPVHFYQAVRQLDPLGHPYEMGYDAYDLAMIETSTSINGQLIRSTAQLDYRLLQPNVLQDPNGNKNEVLFDPLGMVIATAISGKNGEGDRLDQFQMPTFPNQDMRQTIFDQPHEFLQTATAIFYYDLFVWLRDRQPNYALSIVRETHVAEEQETPSNTQINFSYSDGFGQTIMLKVQAEPGDAQRWDNGVVVTEPANPRWVGNGRTVFNNKGNPVKQYEPYFSDSFDYESESELVEYGVTPILHYDALDRNIRTDLPDGNFTKVEFTAWEQHTFDQNDTVLESDWYAKNSASTNVYEQRAATLAAAHANTPKVEYLDTLGRVFLLVDDDGSPDKVKTHFELDLLGNQLRVTDALGRLMTINYFNLLGEPVKTESMDAGRRWMLSNIFGNLLYQWNDRHFSSRQSYDVLQRATGTFLAENGAAEEQVYKTVYGENHPNPASLNLIGQAWKIYDQSGLLTSDGFDFKGNPLGVGKQIAADYKNRLDWSANTPPTLEPETYTTTTIYDALNRPLISTAPDGSETRYTYNEANFLETIDLSPTTGGGTTIVRNIDYDAKGQRTRIQYGNGVTTSYSYDDKTFRLLRLRSTRPSPSAGGQGGGTLLQDLFYHYDPVGNITDLRDDAQATIFYGNQAVEPHGSYTYDPLYRLIKAEGREQIGQASRFHDPKNDFIVSADVNPNDGQAMRRYQREYEFDKLGNILTVHHRVPSDSSANWTRTYQYRQPSFLDPSDYSNHLSATISPSGGGTGGGALTSHYTHDPHGNMTTMPHLPQMNWDFADQLKDVDLRGGGREYYTYTIAGGKDFGVRTRKVWEKSGGLICDRIYIVNPLGIEYEVYRERTPANGIQLERTTLHIQDDKGRIALVDQLTTASGVSPSGGGAGGGQIRYQFSNHLGSATLELDATAQLISYEEYYPYGASSYRAGRSAREVAEKRFRYVGKERDESTGLDLLRSAVLRFLALSVCECGCFEG